MTRRISESTCSWLSLAGAVVPPRDPDDDEDEGDEENGDDEDDNREPAVIREPDEDLVTPDTPTSIQLARISAQD